MHMELDIFYYFIFWKQYTIGCGYYRTLIRKSEKAWRHVIGISDLLRRLNVSSSSQMLMNYHQR